MDFQTTTEKREGRQAMRLSPLNDLPCSHQENEVAAILAADPLLCAPVDEFLAEDPLEPGWGRTGPASVWLMSHDTEFLTELAFDADRAMIKATKPIALGTTEGAP
jgi:hypothetical protein